MFSVILVEPKYDGNIGAVARVMKNFSFSNLILVKPCKIGEEAYKRAMHGVDILENAKVVTNFEEAIARLDYAIGTTSIANISERKYLRIALTPSELAEKVAKLNADIGLIFGKEDFGLSKEELKKCDLLVSIPCDKEYPVMNVAHAAAVILYELRKAGTKIKTAKRASKFETTILFNKFSELLDLIDYPEHRKDNTRIMFRRIIGRATLSQREFYNLAGILSRASKLIKEEKKMRKY
ncbi:MAG: RNA methyltransferase [Candidatus Thermoplasmatota archaeon]|nr:RNA methyltransferase [Candidatus Thermoplasmatota archaeon]